MFSIDIGGWLPTFGMQKSFFLEAKIIFWMQKSIVCTAKNTPVNKQVNLFNFINCDSKIEDFLVN